MNSNKFILIAITVAVMNTGALANPIPCPPPANMPLKEMHITILDGPDGLHASFSGEFTFTYIPEDVNSMLFPVPPDASNIHVFQETIGLTWDWSSELYPTILPEMPTIPMIEWLGPFPIDGTVFTVSYEHDLIERPDEFVFFYAVGTGKYFPTYEKTTTAYFDILLPEGFYVAGVRLDENPHDYEIVGSHLMITVESYFSPITNDLIVSLVPEPYGDIDGDGNVVLPDFADLASRWLNMACGICGGADLTGDGNVGLADLLVVTTHWLQHYEAPILPEKPDLATYYLPYDNPVEPNAPGYVLPLNLDSVGNYAAMDSMFHLASSESFLEQNGFTVIEYCFPNPDAREDIVIPYKYLQEMDVPLFITADTLLHLYHIQFDETLKDVEKREFYGDIRDLTDALLNRALTQYENYTGDLREAARRNAAYLAVAQKLIDPNSEVPELVTDEVFNELSKIEAHAGFAPSDIFIYKEDYSQYIPRGHYTRTEELKQYFKTLMWYGRMAFLLKGDENWGPVGDALISVYDAKIQTIQAVLLATSIEEAGVGEQSGREIWDRMYAITSFYVGLSDDLTPYEYLGAVNKIFGSSFVPTDLEDEDNFFALKAELSLLRSPEIFGGTGNVFVIPPITPESLNEVLVKTKGMRFMGQRFIPDSYMFQHLVFPEVLDYTGNWDPVPFTLGFTGVRWARCYPRGLDVMAILGSTRAETILAAEGDTDYIDYSLRFGKLKEKFDTFDISDWNRNLYWGWLYSLRALIDEFPVGYPNFMRTQAWEKKELNAALASWTQLRHDTILYAKQSYTPPEWGWPPEPPGYVEPVPEFYGRLLALTRMTREGLTNFDALSTQAMDRLMSLENILIRLIEIANKELMNQKLSDDDYSYIRNFDETLELTILGVDEQGVKTTLVADVHTHGFEEQVVEEAVGYVDLIIVACPIPDGTIVLAAGPVLSYYEFKHPMNDRLTDDAWRELLDSPQRPSRPTWWF